MKPWLTLAAPLAGLLVALRLAPRRSRLVRVAPLSAADIDAHLANHTLVHIGGQHRGGTTLLASAFGTHPLIATHGSYDAAATSTPEHLHGEGLFLQDVYSKMSLDHPPLFFLKKRALAAGCRLLQLLGMSKAWREDHCRLLEGVGSYAFSSEARELARPAHPLAAREPARRLFAQWAAWWDLSRPVLLEKSPSNALAAAMLSGMWAAAGSRDTRFVFISRHPLVQALAMRTFVDDLGLRALVQHWLAVEEAIRQSVRNGQLRQHSVAMLSLEGLASRPRYTMEALLAWIGLEPRCHYGRYGCVGGHVGGQQWARSVLDIDDSAMSLEHPGPSRPNDGCTAQAAWHVPDAWLRTVHRDPNGKYAERYASELKRSATAREQHEALVAEFGQRVYEVSGYTLKSHAPEDERIERSERGILWGPRGRETSNFGYGPNRETLEWWRGWCGQKEVRF